MSICGKRNDAPGGPVACDPCRCADELREELGIEQPPRISTRHTAAGMAAALLARAGVRRTA